MVQTLILRFTKAYEHFFSVEEIALSARLKSIFIVSWFICFIDLLKTADFPIHNSSLVPVCWPYWSHCADQYHFDSFPNSYNYTIWTGIIFAFLTATIWFFFNKKWNRAHFFLLLVILWKFVLNFVLVDYHRTGLELFHLLPSFVLLFSRRKMQGLRYIWSLLCLFFVRVQLDEGWIVGTYFSSLRVGLALVPNFLIPIATNIAIIFEIICSVGLLSRNQRFGRFSFWAWTVFHIYSAAIVGFFYPIRCIGFLWAIFAFPEKEAPPEIPFRRYLDGRTSVLALLVIVMGFLPFFISENVFTTFEGMDYGFFMNNSTYQCLNSMEQFNQGGEKVDTWKTGSITSVLEPCFPQDVLQELQQTCHKLGPQDRIAWKFWESRNGGPFYELVNEVNACSLEYKAFSHNDWIHLPAHSPEVGYPKMGSLYYNNPNRWPYVQSSPVTPPPNSFFMSIFPWLQKIYLTLWGAAFLYLLHLLFGGQVRFLRRKVLS